MSLVYAKKLSSGEIFFISDTKFTYPEPQTNNEEKVSSATEFFGGLKTIILHGGMTVAFAGEVEYAKVAIEGIYEKDVNLWELEPTLEYFKQFADASNGETDFLLSCYKEDMTASLFKIQSNNIEEMQVAWIGDFDGFEELQNNIQNSLQRDVEQGHSEAYIIGHSEEKQTTAGVREEIAKIYPSFLNTVNSEKCSTVSGSTTISCTSKIGNRYVEHHFISGPPKEATSGNGAIYFGNASSGSHYIASGREVNCPVYPVTFDMGKFGVIYSPTKCFTPQVIKYTDKSKYEEAYKLELQDVAKRIDSLYNRLYGH
ncbi:hypothetical protein [Halobacteriovorax sp. RT-1-4]|uniref:hypothetical protein n=1 Tax=unclassified Halobacteriovorax TaxID=2639665 RepID=UPI00399B103A